jgi:hypothetical protein
MQPQNWKAIEGSQAISLDDADRALFDKVQTSLALTDDEFLHFMRLIGKLAPAASRLAFVPVRK